MLRAKVCKTDRREVNMAEIGMIGAGSWGTALTWLLTNNGHHVTVWSALDADCLLYTSDAADD